VAGPPLAPSITHPWITFTFDSSSLAGTSWFFLGEAMSKCAHLIGSPLKPSIAEDLAAVYLAKGVHATTAIEGNTLSEEEVLHRVKGERPSLPPSREYLGTEADNIIRAIAEIDAALQAGRVPSLDSERLKHLQ
jgi:hypothetical protein